MALTPDQINDFVSLTLSKFEKLKYVDISQDYQDFTVVSEMWKSSKINLPGGKDNSWRVKVTTLGSARNTEMYAVDQTSVGDVMQSASVPYRMQTANWSYDIDEKAFQSDAETLIDLVKVRETSTLQDIVNLAEENFWTAPTSSSDNRPNGVPYYIVKNATEGFNGGAPTGHTTVADLSPTTYEKWKNWTFRYTSVSKTDLIRKLRRAARKTKFKAPVPFNDLNAGKPKYGYYTTETVVGTMEEVLEAQNDNLGHDLASMDGKAMFKSGAVHWVPYLTDNDSSNPIYGINWNTFFPICKEGGYMRRHKPRPAPLQHTVMNVHIDNWMNYRCTDRRSNFVGYV